jgi:hypothetical protein
MTDKWLLAWLFFDLWLRPGPIAELYRVSIRANERLTSICEEEEIDATAIIRKFQIVKLSAPKKSCGNASKERSIKETKSKQDVGYPLQTADVVPSVAHLLYVPICITDYGSRSL